MPAYYRDTVASFLATDPAVIRANLSSAYAADGFVQQYTSQVIAWDQAVEMLQAECRRVVQELPEAANWGIVLEYPLYRIRKRIDVVFLVGSVVVPVEMKVGATSFGSTDRRQAEEYGLDLRDFHGETRERLVVPSLWATGVHGTRYSIAAGDQVRPLVTLSLVDLVPFLLEVATLESGDQINVLKWDESPYKPVPSIVEAATTIFAGHDVRALARADASNLDEVADTLVSLIRRCAEDEHPPAPLRNWRARLRKNTRWSSGCAPCDRRWGRGSWRHCVPLRKHAVGSGAP